jgi:signal transduction histidine kinase
MKLEKVVTRPKTGLWVFLFILGLAIAGVMATSYNVEIILNNLRTDVPALPWVKIILGSLGFIGIITFLILFFERMIREMKISQFHADFLDRISHELRTPLSTMSLVSDLLRGRPDLTQEERERLWKSHETELNRLKADVESLLQAARLRESRQQVNLMPIDLRDFLTDKWPSFEQLLGPAAVLRREIADEGLMRVRADPTLLELILRNLLDNAKKFSLGQPEVVLRVRVTRRNFEIAVLDRGQGFAPKSQSRLFKRFSRIQSESTEFRGYAVPGTGLGLYLSASAARAMGMTLSGTSLGEGQGAEFKLIGQVDA